jgi:CheY-like chemotaxis protein
LIVEDDLDISRMLSTYFSGQDFDVEIANRGAEALEKTRRSLPDLIVLDIVLPDIDGYEVCRSLRKSTRTSHIPVIFLTQKDERGDRLQGCLRVVSLRATAPPHSSRQLGVLDVRVNDLDGFRDAYGFVAGDNVLRFTAILLTDALAELGSSDDFVGHAGGDDFIITTSARAAPLIRRHIKERFTAEIPAHYNFQDRAEVGSPAASEVKGARRIPLMSLAVGMIDGRQQQFADIREASEAAAEARRQDSVKA